MRVLKEHSDGTRTIAHDPGDRVRFIRPYKGGFCSAEVGEMATVIRVDKSKPGMAESIAFVDVQTDRMRAGKYGVLHVPPWYVEFVDKSNCF